MGERERALRTLFQVIVSAGFAEAVNRWIVNLDPQLQVLATVLLSFAVSYAQNWLEERGKMRPMLKPKPAPVAVQYRIVSAEEARPYLGQ